MKTTGHTPVLLGEVLKGLSISAGKRYIDATVGGGGLGVAIVKRGGILLGVDVDPQAIAYARLRLGQEAPEKIEGRDWSLEVSNFRHLDEVAARAGFLGVDGIVFDLGVSSLQLDDPERGFSYRFGDSPLDLRFNQRSLQPAQEILQRSTEDELYEIFATLGEEQLARPIAHALVSARSMMPIATMGDFTAVVGRLVPKKHALAGILSRILQGLRMAVNDEKAALQEALGRAEALVVPGGRVGVVSFHSGEDRIVKFFFRRPAWTGRPNRVIRPTNEEIARNPRSRSARLRIGEKV